jgi:tetratricopeptide (TPR) repeat protein
LDVPLDDLPVAAAGRIVLMGALFALFSAALSPQPVWGFPHADLRYYMGALPLLLPMKGLFVEWLWRRWKVAGGAALAVLLLTSAGAWPFNARMLLTGERTLGLHLAQFVREIHRPYRDSLRVTSDYLLEHAAQDDLVYVPAFSDREALTFTTGNRVLFCCLLSDESPLPEEARAALPARLVTAATTPDWIVVFGKLDPAYLAKIADFYTVAAQLDVFYYPTQRPEINLHAFTPVPVAAPGVHILRRIPTAALQSKADRYAAAGHFMEAADAYAAVLAVDRDSAAAHAGLGHALFRLGHYAEALDSIADAISRQPDLPGAAALHRLMGQSAQQLGRTEEAAAHFERALQLDPHDAPALDRLALVRIGQRQFAEALDLYDRLIAISPEDAQTHANRGATLYHLGRLDDAIASLERALALEPSLATARSSLERIQADAPQRER